MLFRDFMSDFNCFTLNLKSAEKIVKQLLKPLKKVASIVCFQDCIKNECLECFRVFVVVIVSSEKCH